LWVSSADFILSGEGQMKMLFKSKVREAKMKKWIPFFLSLLTVIWIFPQTGISQDEFVASSENTKVSKFGQYRGYTKEIYFEWVRVSQYIPVRDGTLLAADIYRPAIDGQPESRPLPLIWTHERYHRARLREGKIYTKVDSGRLLTLLKHGYIIAAVDVRGCGASFGTWSAPFSPQEALDAYDITEWFADQPWCDKNIGMFGGSYNGTNQFFAASTAPPHLKAIFPRLALVDVYSFVYPGGILREDFCRKWGELTYLLDTAVPAPAVDADDSNEKLKRAMEEHKKNRNIYQIIRSLPYRNSIDDLDQPLHLLTSPLTVLDKIKRSGVAVYHLGGWFDVFTRDTILIYANLDNPQRMTIGPWYHASSKGEILKMEYLRWFDYWLKGIDNGIMEEYPIHYYTIGAPKGQEWHSTDKWPLSNSRPIVFYFHKGRSGSIDSINDGLLNTQGPESRTGSDIYKVDYTMTSGKPSRWTNGYDGHSKMTPPVLTENDKKGLTYTTAPLNDDLEVTGHPQVHIWISTAAKDLDLFVYLEDVDDSLSSCYVTEGLLRASHRSVAQPEVDFLGLPFHRSLEGDIKELEAEPVELILDLLPTSYIFKKNHRIRVTVACVDKDNALTPVINPPPGVRILRENAHKSYITLPVVQKKSQ
jgi:putative CocE/NonD family hydrolase